MRESGNTDINIGRKQENDMKMKEKQKMTCGKCIKLRTQTYKREKKNEEMTKR